MKYPQQKFRRGFSLIEAAIVMGVVGLVVGTIWVISANVNEASRINRLILQTTLLSQNIRNYYSGRALPTGAAGETTAATFTATLETRGVMPKDICNDSCVSTAAAQSVNEYSGTVRVSIVNTSPYNTYDIALASIPYSACTKAISQMSTRAAELGLTTVTIASTSISTFPISPTTAQSTCSSIALNTVTFTLTITR